jgi:hypothetical protein
MARPARPASRQAIPEPERAYFDALAASVFGKDVTSAAWIAQDDQPVGEGYFGVLLHWPKYADNRRELSAIVRSPSDQADSYSYKDREFISIVLHKHLASNCTMSGHLDDAIASGVRLDAIEAIRRGVDDQLTEDEALLAEYIREVADGAVHDDTWDKMERRNGTRALIHYTICITVIVMAMRQMQAFGLPEWTDAEIDQMLDDYRTGRRKVDPNWTEH